MQAETPTSSVNESMCRSRFLPDASAEPPALAALLMRDVPLIRFPERHGQPPRNDYVFNRLGGLINSGGGEQFR
jgi:hypothetical protein